MTDGRLPSLPNSRPAKRVLPFGIGALVRLRTCLCGQPGRVQGMRRGRVIVKWLDITYVGKHKPEALVLAGPEDKRG